jgi:N-glycosylase/DNA lyase
MRIDTTARSAVLTLPTPEGPRTVRLTARPGAETAGVRNAVPAAPGAGAKSRMDGGAVLLSVAGDAPSPSPAAARAIVATLRRMLCLDDDLSGFYALCAGDEALAWARRGAGRLLCSPTVFEDVVKTVCTTNCAWSATERMVSALVGRLGEPAPGAPADDPSGRAFPTPEAMAGAGEAFYRDVARAGYRAPSLLTIASRVAAGEADLEVLLSASRDELPDDEVERRLLELPGVGPYAAAHVMLLLGRHSRLVLDSWTRPRYARLEGRPPGRLVADRTIARRFRPYGDHAGLAFWLVLTRDWVDDDAD